MCGASRPGIVAFLLDHVLQEVGETRHHVGQYVHTGEEGTTGDNTIERESCHYGLILEVASRHPDGLRIRELQDIDRQLQAVPDPMVSEILEDLLPGELDLGSFHGCTSQYVA
jgi:hypothetical protein